MQAVEFVDSYLRPQMVATFGFLPSLANASSVLYFALCPFLAFLSQTDLQQLRRGHEL